MSTTAIKWLALVLMLVDHLGEFFPQSVPLWFRWLGRMSAPFGDAVLQREARKGWRQVLLLVLSGAYLDFVRTV